MRVAMLSHLASTTAPTGAERVLETLARGLSDRDHQIAVSAPGRWELTAPLEGSGIEVRSIPVRSCWLVQADRQPLWRQVVRGARFLLPDSGILGLKDFITDFEPDVVYVNCLPHLRGAAVARTCGRPVLWHIHEILPPGVRRRWFADRLRRDATQIVAVSDAVAGWLREEGLDDLVVVVHNGVEGPVQLPDRDAARDTFDLPADACVIGLFSQLVEHKGALDFVQAAHQAASDNSRLWFLLAGRGSAGFASRIGRAIGDGPAAGRIRLVPPQPEIWPLLAAVDVTAITTLCPDPLPRVVMEAMAVGLPVAGYDGGGVPEMVVQGETGLLLKAGDVAGLGEAFERLAGDAELRRKLGDAGARRAGELFSVRCHVDRMEALFESTKRA